MDSNHILISHFYVFVVNVIISAISNENNLSMEKMVRRLFV